MIFNDDDDDDSLFAAEMGDYCLTEHSKDYIDGLQFMPNQVWNCLCIVILFEARAQVSIGLDFNGSSGNIRTYETSIK